MTRLLFYLFWASIRALQFGLKAELQEGGMQRGCKGRGLLPGPGGVPPIPFFLHLPVSPQAKRASEAGERKRPPFVSAFRLRRRMQIFADEQAHVVRAIGAPKGLALPPPLPDVTDGPPEIKMSVGRRSIAVAQPQEGANASIWLRIRTGIARRLDARRRHIPLVPLRTHMVLMKRVILAVARHPIRYRIAANNNRLHVPGTAVGILETDARIIPHVPGKRPGSIPRHPNGKLMLTMVQLLVQGVDLPHN